MGFLRGKLVEVDYQRVVEYILENYSFVDMDEVDNPLYVANNMFTEIRAILEDHLENTMTNELGEEYHDFGLAEIIFENHQWGVIKSVRVSEGPGLILRVGGDSLAVPLIIIERG